MRKPRPHQIRAINSAVKYFKTNSRGKLIHPTGTGKSLTALWIAEAIKSKTTLIVVPSIALISQTLKDWKRELPKAKFIAVCSDSTVADDDISLDQADIDIEVSTDPKRLKTFLSLHGRKVVFSTYQSGEVVKKAAGDAIDFAIFDEAHKTAGLDGLFSELVNDIHSFSISRRMFQTATEKRFRSENDQVLSMDSVAVYGDYIDKLSFKEAVSQKLICDYRIVTVEIAEKQLAKQLHENADIAGMQARTAVALCAYEKTIKEYGIKRAISFHRNVAGAQEFALAARNRRLNALHINGKMSSCERSRVLLELARKPALVTNARCLTEGVDVPNIDAVVFADAKGSRIDIAQCVGRSLRVSAGKKFAYVIIPIVDQEIHKNRKSYNRVLDVVVAMASEDDRIFEAVKIARFGRTTSDKTPDREFVDALLNLGLYTLDKSIRIRLFRRCSKIANFYSYEELQAACRNDKITTQRSYLKWYKQDARAPSQPHSFYKCWISWDHLFMRTEPRFTLDELKAATKKDGIKNCHDYIAWQRSSYRAPSNPANVYPEWISWPHFFGRTIKHYTYDELKLACKAAGIESGNAYLKWCGSDKRAPWSPRKHYPEWKGWPAFFERKGRNPTKRKPPKHSFFELQQLCQNAGVDRKSRYVQFRKTIGAPSIPRDTYPNEWKGWPHFFGRPPMLSRKDRKNPRKLQPA